MIIYLDHNATSPPSEAHLRSLGELLVKNPGNPSSPHGAGRSTSAALTLVRRRLAHLLEAEPGEIVFVSGGTEANNLATTGVCRLKALAEGVKLPDQHAIVSALEHPSVIEPLRALESQGLNLTVLPVSETGELSLSDIISAIRPQTSLISVMAANNEIGSVLPVKALGDYLQQKRWSKNSPHELDSHLAPQITPEHLQKMHFHVDAVQAFGKLPSHLWLSLGIDSLSISGHKLGALAGCGALLLRRGRRYEPFHLGGAQERNRRAGTENFPGILSLGLVLNELEEKPWWESLDRIRQYSQKLEDKLQSLPGVKVLSHARVGLPNTVSFLVNHEYLKGEDLLMELDLNGIQASSGAACSSGTGLPSKVIQALGISPEKARNSIRLSLSPKTTWQEILTTWAICEKFWQKHLKG